jgi:hypothetical protein
MSPPKLSVHKSNLEKRERRTVKREAVGSLNALLAGKEIVAYAIVVFDKSGNAWAAFDTGRIMPLWAFPGACEYVLKSEVERVDEDFEAPLKHERPFK